MFLEYEHNCYLFCQGFCKKKSTTSMICALGCFVSQNCHLLIIKPMFWFQVSVTDKLKSTKSIFFSSYCHIHGTWVSQEVTLDSFHMTQPMGIISSVTQDGFIRLLFKFLSVRQIGQMCIPSTRLFVVIEEFSPNLK